jgi:hypothetical protein
MSIDYIEASIRQTIPADCLANIEKWLLTRLFSTKETDTRLRFYASWSLNDFYEGELSPDDELINALAASREICPELCAEVEREMNKNGKIIQGAINYERIFQSIVRRHPNFLDHVSIEEFDCNTKRTDHRETLTMITAQSITSVTSDGSERNQLPLSPYIRCWDAVATGKQ